MSTLPIVWQRLVSAGQTCRRCAGTGEHVQHAVVTLARVLAPLDITPELDIREIDESTFAANPAESNRIWIAGTPLEDWLDARVGSSRCCSVCGDSPCRTVELGAATFEEVPERLILAASLRAAADLLAASAPE